MVVLFFWYLMMIHHMLARGNLCTMPVVYIEYRIIVIQQINSKYSKTWELGTPKGLWKTVLNSEVVLFFRSISMYWIGLGTEVALLYSQVVPFSQVVLKAGFTVYRLQCKLWYSPNDKVLFLVCHNCEQFGQWYRVLGIWLAVVSHVRVLTACWERAA